MKPRSRIIGVFDSGVGGLAIANAIKKAMPDYEVILGEDKENLPYGSKPPEEVYGYVVPILESMVKNGCQVILIACNTVTTTLITRLRQHFKVPLIGVEPMVKQASRVTKSKTIAVFATPATLASSRYDYLKKKYAKNIKIIEPDCSDWAYLIEKNQLNRQKIETGVKRALDQNADVLVLGCTHYHWIEQDIKSITEDKVTILQPEQVVVSRLQVVLEQLP